MALLAANNPTSYFVGGVLAMALGLLCPSPAIRTTVTRRAARDWGEGATRDSKLFFRFAAIVGMLGGAALVLRGLIAL